MNATVNDPVVLGCWKEIAQYLGKGVRTVQRWEREFGLPVRRPEGAIRKSAVIADGDEIDEWLKQRWSRRNAIVHAPAALRSVEEPDLTGLRVLIQSNQVLRKSHHVLVQELSFTVHALMDNCSRISRPDGSWGTSPPAA